MEQTTVVQKATAQTTQATRPPSQTSRDCESGHSFVELAVIVALLGIATAILVPPFLSWTAGVRLDLAANELSGTFRLARAYAIKHNTNVGLKFYPGESVVRYGLYRDDDGDGVRTDDIRSGIDPEVMPVRDLIHLGRQVSFGFPAGLNPRDPNDPRRRLGRLHDPVRFNRSDIASFSPLGVSTPGTIYLTDGRHLLAVRVNNRRGRVRIMRYLRDQDVWDG